MLRYPVSLSLKLIRFISNSNSNLSNVTHRFFSDQPSWSNHTDFPTPRAQFIPSLHTPINPNPNFRERDFNTLCTLLKNPNFLPDTGLESALEEIGIEPTSYLLLSIFKRLDLSPKEAFSLFKWAEKRLEYYPCAAIFNLMLNILGKSGEFKWALMVLMDKIKKGDGFELVSAESFGVLIRHYARSGMILPAIRTFELANNLEMDLLEVLLAALCKYGHVKIASDFVDRKMYLDPDWVPSIDVFNTLLDGWFRVRNVKHVERFWLQMRREKLVTDVVTYGILVEGYCRMGCVDKAIELLGEMRRYGFRPNNKVFGPIVDALAWAGRFKEALGMLERFLVLESGPTLLTFNSLVKGFCKAGDLAGAGKILKMMTSRGVMPTSMFYNYFFRYFSKHGEVEDGVNLYRKMIESGYDPDQLTFHLLLKMLCEQERLELAIQIRKEMRLKGHDLDLATSTALINLLCKMHRLKEAVAEFEDLIHRGFVPMYLTYKILHNELKKKGLHELAQNLSELAATVPSLTTSPNTVEGHVDTHQRRKYILQRAKVVSDILKNSSDPRKLAKCRLSCKITSASKNTVEKG